MQSSSNAGEPAKSREVKGEDGSQDAGNQRQGHSYKQYIVSDSARTYHGDTHYEHMSTWHKGASERSVMDALEFPDMDTRRATIAMPHGNTCRWFFDSPEYKSWRNDSLLPEHHGFLWIQGKPGVGKSTLMKLAVKHANTHFPDDFTISFFFNARGFSLEKSVEGMYRSLLHQLLTRYPVFERVLKPKSWDFDQKGWPVKRLEEHFRNCVLQLGKRSLTCHIDALDECEEFDIRAMIDFFDELGGLAVFSGVRLRTCFASRHYPNFTISRSVHLNFDSLQAHKEDIEAYVRGKLKVSDLALLVDLVDQISRKASGIFLWVVLVVRMLNKENDRGHGHRLQAQLDAIPDDLHGLFEDVVTRGVDDNQYFLPTLLYIMFASRPLTPLELYCGVLHTSRDFDPAADENKPDRVTVESFIITVSKGLAEIIPPSRSSESGEARVRFIDERVREYLLRSGISKLDPSLGHNPFGSSQETLKAWCLEYVSVAGQKIRQSQQPRRTGSDASSKSHKQLLDKFPFLSYAVRGLVIHAELAQTAGITQTSFVENFPLDLVIELSNLVSDGDKQHVPYPLSTSAADLFARLYASDLLQLERAREENGFRQFERSELTDSLPDLTMGSSDRYASEGIHDNTDSIRTDNEDNNLDSGEKSSYSKIFVSELEAGLYEVLQSKSCDHYARVCMSDSLPQLLKSYALLLARRARSGIEKETITFIRHGRTGVTESFKTRVLAMPTKVGVPGLREKMELLSNISQLGLQDEDRMLDPDMDLADFGVTSPKRDALVEDGNEMLFDIIGETRIRLARKFMIEEGNDFQWLLRRLKIAAGLTTGTTETDVRNELVKLVGTNLEFTLDLDWDPVEFIDEQYRLYNATECRLQEVICLCGAGNNVQALSCVGYASKMWPHLGPTLLDLTSQAMDSATGTYKGSLQGYLPVEIEITFTRSGTAIKIRGDTSALVESSTFFVWLSAAVRAAPQENLTYSTPELRQIGTAGCRVTHRFSQPSSDLSQTCWHGMFQNPVIAHGYPIAPRSAKEQGLEMPFFMMAVLAQTPFATCFEGATMLKGFSTILSLTKRAEASFTWHFLIDQHRKRMPYSDGLTVTKLREEVVEHDLRMGRHFVGWTPCVDMLAGTAEANYHIGPTAQFPSEPPLLSVGSVTVGFSKIVSLGMTFVPGKKDIPDALQDMRTAEERIIAATDWTVLFYDISTRQAWLLDGPSALLHICRAWLESEHAKSLFEHLGAPDDPISAFEHANTKGGMSEAVRLLLNSHNRDIRLYKVKGKAGVETTVEYLTKQRKVEENETASWRTWGEIVEARVLDLEHLHDQKFVERGKRTGDIHSPFQHQRMDGYDFQEIMKEKRRFQKWGAQFQSSFGGWLDFVESCNAVPIFGAGFGDLLRPATTYPGRHQTCPQKTPLPRDNDYLAVSMEVLHQLTKDHLKVGSHCVRLGSSTYWQDPEAAFTPCNCDSISCNMLIARLASKEPGPTLHSTSLDQLFAAVNMRGAVIFPCTPNQVKKLSPQRQPRRSLFDWSSSQTLSPKNNGQLPQPERGLILPGDVEDTRAGAQPEDEDALDGPPNQNPHAAERIEPPSDKARDTVLLLVPQAWQTALRAAGETEAVRLPSAIQRENSRDLVQEVEDEEYISLAEDLENADWPGTPSEDAPQQPRLRKKKASQALREQARMARTQQTSILRIRSFSCLTVAAFCLFAWLLWRGAGWLRAWGVISAILIAYLVAIVAGVL